MTERAILTFKSYFKVGMASLDPDYPIRKWDRLLPQAETMLNLLRSARLNPKLSAHAFLFGQFDYNKTYIFPSGIKVVLHKKPADRGTWAPNGDDGWAIGPSPEHYRCLKYFITKTRVVRDTDTLEFFPREIPYSKVTLDDFLRQSATDLITLLTSPSANTTISLEGGDTTRNALLKLAKILNRAEKKPNLDPPPPTQITETVPAQRVQQSTKTIPAQRVSPTLKNLTWKPGDQKEPQRRYNLRSSIGINFKGMAADVLLAQHIFNANQIFNAAEKKLSIDSLINGEDGEKKMETCPQ